MWGDGVRSYSILLKWPSGDEESEEIRPGGRTEHFLHPSVSRNALKPAPDVGATSLVSLGLEDRPRPLAPTSYAL